MIFDCGTVISASGLDFGVETSEPETSAINPDFGGPFAGAFFVIDANITRGSFRTDFGPVAGVFRMRGRTQVGPPVIEGFVVPVVNEKISRRVHNKPVHTGHPGFALAGNDIREGVKFLAVAADVPVEFFQPVIILWFDDCPFAVAEINPSIRPALFVLSINHNRPRANPV